jgi:hypothetical protein
MAAPHVAGGIALMLHKNPTLTHSDIKTRLVNGCDGRPSGTPPTDFPGWGGGRISTMNTVNPLPDVNPPVPMMAAPSESGPPPLLQQFLGTRFGPAYYELAQKYFREILDLVNTNKKVATVWHRNRGPAWVRVALNAFFNPEFKIPLTVSGHNFHESIESFLPMLKRFASPQLLSELERCEPKINVVREEMTLFELMNVLGNQPLSPELEVKYGS